MPPQESEEAAVLRQQPFGPEGPGSVLRDFQTLLEFIGLEGVRTTGKYHLLPQGRLPELDERMTRPLRPTLVRPQLRSYPHLSGLYLVLRATELAIPQGEGKTTGRLVPNPPLMAQWQALNDTERYFNLLETWLLFGSHEILGERTSGWGDALVDEVVLDWAKIPRRGAKVKGSLRESPFVGYGPKHPVNLALLELFGLLEIDRAPPAKGETWGISAIRHTPFGFALMKRISTEAATISYLPGDRPRGRSGPGPFDFAERERSDDADQENGDEEPHVGLGAWQSFLGEFFPAWQNNLQFPQPEFRDGVYQFMVTLKGTDIWRRIGLPAEATLDDLAGAIIGSYDFDGDHLYAFTFRQPDGRLAVVEHPHSHQDNLVATECQVGFLPLEEKQSLSFVYDFGANWNFDVRLEKLAPPDPKLKKAKLLESHGQAPPQHGNWDE